MMITSSPFGKTAAGELVTKWTLDNERGMRVCVLDWGCTVQSLFVRDKKNRLRDIVLGCDDMAGYEQSNAFMGALIGRYAGRISRALLPIDGAEYALFATDGGNYLHGSFHRRLYDLRAEGETLVCRRQSPDGEDGFPGNLMLELRYSLTAENGLKIEYHARCDKNTCINLTNHSYFNLAGAGNGNILDHVVSLPCEFYLDCGSDNIPSGQILKVEHTPLDFRRGKSIAKDIESEQCLIRSYRGFDHSLLFTRGESGGSVCSAFCPRSGIVMTVFSDQPSVQLYSGQFLDENGKNGAKYGSYDGFCLECQHLPDSPRFAHFPATFLAPGSEYRAQTEYRFSLLPA